MLVAKFKIKISGDRFIIYKAENLNWRLLVAEGFGQLVGDGIVLNPVEAAYLILKNRAESKPHITVEEIIRRYSDLDEFFPFKLSVYIDLRDRRFTVKVLDEDPITFEVFGEGADPVLSESKYYVMILPSEKSISVHSLYAALEKAKKQGKTLVLALIDQDGDIVYYNVESTLRFEVSLKLRRMKIV